MEEGKTMEIKYKEWILEEDFDADQAIEDALAIICGQEQPENEEN